MATSKNTAIETLRTSIGAGEHGRRYEAVYTFAITFEEDDTEAASDVQHFQTILRLLGLPAANEITVSAADAPGWKFMDVIRDLDVKAQKVSGRSLVIGFYAGHGGADSDGLYFQSIPDSPKVGFRRWWSFFWDEESVLERTDVVLILDCCYLGSVVRSGYTASRTVEVIAAAHPDQKAPNASYAIRTETSTFTSRLADEIAKQVEKPGNGISLRDVIKEMRKKAQNSDQLPVYKIFTGLGPIKIPFPQGRARHSPSTSVDNSEEFSAIFTFDAPPAETMKGEHEALRRWLRSLDPSLGIQLVDMYKTRSVTFLLHAKWSTWATLDGLPGVALVAETYGRGLLHPFPPYLSPGLSQLQATPQG